MRKKVYPVYAVTYESVDGTDWAREMIEAENAQEAVDTCRSLFSDPTNWKITEVCRVCNNWK